MFSGMLGGLLSCIAVGFVISLFFLFFRFIINGVGSVLYIFIAPFLVIHDMVHESRDNREDINDIYCTNSTLEYKDIIQ